MSTYFFKTNFKCEGCVEKVKPQLDKLQQSNDIDRWDVDLSSPEKILSVETQKLSPEQVKHIVREAGYDAEFTRPPQAK